MPLATADAVRLRIQDQARPAYEVRYGDGITTRFELPHRNITSATGYVQPGGTAWSGTASVTFDVSGFVEFTTIIPNNSAVNFRYVYSVFSDAEISHFTAVGGNVAGAALEAVRALRFDGLRRAKWAASDGTQYDDTAALQALDRLESALRLEAQEASSAGDLTSWGERQEEYL